MWLIMMRIMTIFTEYDKDFAEAMIELINIYFYWLMRLVVFRLMGTF